MPQRIENPKPFEKRLKEGWFYWQGPCYESIRICVQRSRHPVPLFMEDVIVPCIFYVVQCILCDVKEVLLENRSRN